MMVEAAGIEPASENTPPSVLHAYPVINLTNRYPTGRKNDWRSRISFNGSTPGALHRDLVITTPVTECTSTAQADGTTLVIKQLVRSCLRWQL